eukprot:SAG31_NODE_3129_length_4646_cov_2.581262_4_plen_58_part_00
MQRLLFLVNQQPFREIIPTQDFFAAPLLGRSGLGLMEFRPSTIGAFDAVWTADVPPV